jgi:murein tripeptide amidase MpaA
VNLVDVGTRKLENLPQLDSFGLDLKHRAARRRADGMFVVPGILSDDEIRRVRDAGFIVEIVTDLSPIAEERRRDVSPVNRFAAESGLREFDRRAVLGYLTGEEIDAALLLLERENPQIVTRIELPHRTWEGRTSAAIRLAAGTRSERAGVYFTGGVHAREWGGSDICVHLAIRLLNSYRTNAPLAYGRKVFSAEQVRTILENLDIFVFPNVNPDGKHYSQSYDPAGAPGVQRFWWRKNRNPNGGGDVGVDVNRNFDFLWSSGIGTSTWTSGQTYRGSAPESEPEARNLAHMFDAFPNIGFFVDVHSFGELILYSWGDDDNQNDQPDQNFRNPTYDGMRGRLGDSRYREYISAQDEQTSVMLATRMNAALQAVRGRRYTVQQSVGLYPTTATSDDYAYSRHMVDDGSGRSRGKVFGYTLEFGEEFVPPFAEMRNIIDEVGAALTELCWTAAADAATDSGDGGTNGADAPKGGTGS